MALHNYVVRRIAKWHRDQGDAVRADHLQGYQKPPAFHGPRGRMYYPDVYVENKRIVYEVKDYGAARSGVSKIKAMADTFHDNEVILVLCTGTPSGVLKVSGFLKRHGISCEALNYQELPFWHSWGKGR
jgi:hypothetical protein